MTVLSGYAYDVYYGFNRAWKAAQPINDEYDAARAHGIPIAGVVGDAGHWNMRNAGDHTSRSTHCIGSLCPNWGWVYAIDLRPPNPAAFEQWFLARLRSGQYPQVKYWNILERNWSRSNGFSSSWYNSDDHFHLSIMPGYEGARSSILNDYMTGGDDVNIDEHNRLFSTFDAVFVGGPSCGEVVAGPPGINGGKGNSVFDKLDYLVREVRSVRAKVDALQLGGVDVAALAAALAAKGVATEAQVRDAVADFGEGGADKVRADAD